MLAMAIRALGERLSLATRPGQPVADPWRRWFAETGGESA